MSDGVVEPPQLKVGKWDKGPATWPISTGTNNTRCGNPTLDRQSNPRGPGGSVDFEQILKEVLWRLVTEGSISYRRIKRVFGIDDDALDDVRRELIGALHIATDLDGELLVWAPDGRAARPEPMALPQPLPALRHAEKPTALAAEQSPKNVVNRHYSAACSTIYFTLDASIVSGPIGLRMLLHGMLASP
jgi:hypothetical protein